jgi:hypothetical protein
VTLSLVSDSWYFVEFADGSTNFILPPGWHDTVNNVTTMSRRAQAPKMYTSHNLAPPPSYHSPQPVRFGTSPLNRSQGSPDPSYIPLPPSPYHSPIYAHPSPQPIFINNVYNMPPAPAPRKHKSGIEKYEGVIQAVGCALKIAAVLLL